MNYEPPEGFEERLRLVERNLSAKWNPRINRWQILRLDPRRPSNPPHVVTTVCGQNAEFQPLDQRILDKLYRMDVWRRFEGKKPEQMRPLLERALAEEQAKLDRAKKAKADEAYADAEEKMRFAVGKDLDHTAHPPVKMG